MVAELSASRWRDDLDHLVDSLRRQHANLHHTTSGDAFDRAVRALRARIPTLAPHEVVVELARLVASIGDGHTALRLAEVSGFRRYPIVPYWFSDGIHVRAIGREHLRAAGARVLAVDDTPIDMVVSALRPLIARDNEMGVIAVAPTLLGIPEVLHACGVTVDPARARFTVQQRDGTVDTMTLPALPDLPANLGVAHDGATASVPLWLRRPAGENWYEHLPDHRMLYVGLTRISDGASEPLARFFDRIFETVEREAVERLILDLRLNHGGNNLLNRDLIHHLIRCDRVNRWGRLFAVVGRLTFSAAMNLVVDLEHHTRVLFVGEPTGSSPNQYGETGSIVLPGSGIEVSVSMLWWQPSLPFDDRPAVAPDIPAWLSSRDYAANHDPAVSACLAYRDGDVPLLEYPDRVFVRLRLDDARLAPDGGGSASPGN